MSRPYLTDNPVIFAHPMELENMLKQAEKAHAASGHSAQDWPAWYAQWIFDQFNGITR